MKNFASQGRKNLQAINFIMRAGDGMDGARAIIDAESEATAKIRSQFFRENREQIAQAALQTALALAGGGKLLICGNGGSAADAQHVAGEFVNRFLLDRPALPAISLVTDTSVITAIANDSAYDEIFARQVEALGTALDVLLAISTSGNSPNVLKAMQIAREKNMFIIGLTGNGGKMGEFANILIRVPSGHTPHIQEMHLVFEHLYCRLTDYFLFENPAQLAKLMEEQS